MLERLTHIRFADPAWLWVLATLPAVFWWGRRSIAGLGRFRSGAALATRALVIAGLAAALARAQLVLTREDMAVAYVVDMSLSIPKDKQQESLDVVAQWEQASASRRETDRAALVTFGKNAAIDQPFGTQKVNTTATTAVINPEHTDLAAAIRTAVAAMPQAGRKRIVLLSDANENDGAAVSEAAAAKASGVRIDCLPVRYGYTKEVMIEKLNAPQEASAGKTASVTILVRAFNEARGTLRLYANGNPVAAEDVTLKPGINAFAVEKPLGESGVYDWKAVVETEDDSLYQNNSATAFTIVRGPKKVLLVQGQEEDGAALAQALVNEKVAVDVTAPGGFPPAVALLTGYDTVILANVAAFDLPADTIKTLQAAVRDYGVGLVMVGGDNSFGAGGWRGTPVEETLPVEMDVKDRQVVPTGALVVIMHTCEFPDGNRWGINIAKAAVDTLGRYDEFGLLHLSLNPVGERWLVPLAPVVDRVKIKSLINTMDAGDMPSFDTTLKMAEAALVKSQSSVKHIVIISDGDPASPPTAFLQKIASEGITVSTVAVFPHDGSSTGNMKAIAQLCKGRFYYPSSPTQLPQIFIKEARTVRRGLLFEKPFIPSMVMTTVPVKGFSQGDFPELKGYVISTAKPLAEVPLVTNNEDPLLAHWQYGLGRSAAFTSDAKARWAADWLGWQQYGQFWGQVVEWVERKIETGEFSTTCRITGDTATIAVDAIDKQGAFVNFIEFAGTVLSPDGQTQAVKLEQTGPGHYEGTFKADSIGTYLPNVHYKDRSGNDRIYTTAVTVPFSPEYKALSTNDVLLRELSNMTGGEVIGPEADVYRRDFPAESSYTDIWQWILAGAAALFLVDVFLRRVIIDYAKVLETVREALWWVPWFGEGRVVRAERLAYTATLLGAKKAARETRQEAARKFAPEEGGSFEPLEAIEQEQVITRARARAEKSAAAAPPPKEVAKEAEETFTGRLLEAKRRARKERTGRD